MSAQAHSTGGRARVSFNLLLDVCHDLVANPAGSGIEPVCLSGAEVFCDGLRWVVAKLWAIAWYRRPQLRAS